MISYAGRRSSEGYEDLTLIWRVQLFNYIAFTLALVSLAANNQLSPFNKLVALHLTYMYLTSTLTGSLLVHPTYFNGPSTKRRWNIAAVTIVRVLGGILPAVVCAWSGGPPNCMNFQEIEHLRWITLFSIPVGERTAYALILTLACVVLLLHIALSPDNIPEAIMASTLSRFITVSQPKWIINGLMVFVFFVYWLEVFVAIERSMIVNFGSNIKAQNNWGFGQVGIFDFVCVSHTTHDIFKDPLSRSTVPCFRGRLVERHIPETGPAQSTERRSVGFDGDNQSHWRWANRLRRQKRSCSI